MCLQCGRNLSDRLFSFASFRCADSDQHLILGVVAILARQELESNFGFAKLRPGSAQLAGFEPIQPRGPGIAHTGGGIGNLSFVVVESWRGRPVLQDDLRNAKFLEILALRSQALDLSLQNFGYLVKLTVT